MSHILYKILLYKKINAVTTLSSNCIYYVYGNQTKAFYHQIIFSPIVLCKSKRRVVYITARLSV